VTWKIQDDKSTVALKWLEFKHLRREFSQNEESIILIPLFVRGKRFGIARVNGTATKEARDERDGTGSCCSLVLRGTRVCAYSLSRRVGLRDITTAPRYLSVFPIFLFSSRWTHLGALRVQRHSANRITWRDNEPGEVKRVCPSLECPFAIQ